MERALLSGRSPVRSVARLGRRTLGRATAKLESLVYPEADSAANHYQRLAMNRAIDRRLGRLDVQQLSAAEISGANHAHLSWRKHRNLDYPTYDLCGDLSAAGRFDVVICEQVLEHVVDPLLAARNLGRLCEPGGHVIVSTPFLIRIHELPEYGMRDYWRFTPRGLRTLLERAGLEVESVASWGNRQAVIGNLRSWAAYRRWQPLGNDPDLAVQVWAFARAPLTAEP